VTTQKKQTVYTKRATEVYCNIMQQPHSDTSEVKAQQICPPH